MDTTLQPWPVCPHCGYEHQDAWEWDLGPGLEGDGEYECSDCEKPFYVSRSVTVYYTTKPAPNNAEVRGASRLAGEASSREAATSTDVLGANDNGERDEP